MQGVSPRREVGGWGMPGGTSQTKATMPEAELGAAADELVGQELAGGFNTQEGCKAGRIGTIMCSRESPRRRERQDPEHVLSSVRGAGHNTAATTKHFEGLERRGVWLASGRAA